MRIVIVGGGIHGVSIAYYLARRGVTSTIIEISEIAAAASGKSGGFLAREWGSGCTTQLHHLSYDMHAQLAQDLHLQSYRTIDTLSVEEGRRSSAAHWIDGNATSTLMDRVTAQVTPGELTHKMAEYCIAKGCEVLLARVTGLAITDNIVTGVHIAGTDAPLPADKVVLALGPWTGVAAEDWLQLALPMEGIKSTSLIYSHVSAMMQEPYACFCAEDAQSCHLELYPRPDGSLYVCGCGGSDHVFGDRLRLNGDCDHPSRIEADLNRVRAAQISLHNMCTLLQQHQPSVIQACMRPCLPDGLPAMGAVAHISGAFISAGHNCWGILWAPACGLSMAELILDGQSSSIDLTPFNPNRFQRSKKETARGRKRGALPVGEQW